MVTATCSPTVWPHKMKQFVPCWLKVPGNRCHGVWSANTLPGECCKASVFTVWSHFMSYHWLPRWSSFTMLRALMARSYQGCLVYFKRTSVGFLLCSLCLSRCESTSQLRSARNCGSYFSWKWPPGAVLYSVKANWLPTELKKGSEPKRRSAIGLKPHKSEIAGKRW